MEWSHFQKAIFQDANDEMGGSTVVVARAGTGKTTTAVEALHYADPRDRILMVAFNKSIAKELGKRAPDHVRVSTLHGHGFGAVRREFGNVELNERLSQQRLKGQFPNVQQRLRTAACKATSLAKSSLVEPADRQRIELIYDRGWFVDLSGPAERQVAVDMVAHLLKVGREPLGEIDFDDMVWLPVVNKLSCFRNDRVFVDEAQDLNPCQHALVGRSIKRGGRLCAFGDPRQAIYQFRGADRNSMAKFEKQFGARTLPLSITYRCPRAVVELVKPIVPDFEAAEGCPEGLVAEAPWDKMVADAVPGDFILSRVNAPLISLCLDFIKEGRRASILGRNIGKGLEALIRKSGAGSADALLAWIRSWCAEEVARVRKADVEANVSFLIDRRACIEALCDGASSVDDVVSKVQHLFADGDPLDRITLSSTHRAKGLERRRVWMLRETYLRNNSDEEQNLYYVAATRAMQELYLVKGQL